MILTCDRRYNTFDLKNKKNNIILKISFWKTSQIKKIFKKI